MRVWDRARDIVYENMSKAYDEFCKQHEAIDGECVCPLFHIHMDDTCYIWCLSHPEEAARIMGYELLFVLDGHEDDDDGESLSATRVKRLQAEGLL